MEGVTLIPGDETRVRSKTQAQKSRRMLQQHLKTKIEGMRPLIIPALGLVRTPHVQRIPSESAADIRLRVSRSPFDEWDPFRVPPVVTP
jgi:hypothetical protein